MCRYKDKECLLRVSWSIRLTFRTFQHMEGLETECFKICNYLISSTTTWAATAAARHVSRLHKWTKSVFKVHTFLTVTAALIAAKTIPLFSHIRFWGLIPHQQRFRWLPVLAPRFLIHRSLIIHHLSIHCLLLPLNILSCGIHLCAVCLPIFIRDVLVLSSSHITYQCYADDNEPHLFSPPGSKLCEAFICRSHIDMSVNFSSEGCFCPLWDLSVMTNNSTMTPAACQQFYCNFQQPAVIHQIFPLASLSRTYIY